MVVIIRLSYGRFHRGYVSTLVVTFCARNCVKILTDASDECDECVVSKRNKNNETARNCLKAASCNKFVALLLSIQFLDLCVPSSNRRAL